jgi:transposase-like protein/anti-sigma regulatory factor (Ser/Thr protein kinase)
MSSSGRALAFVEIGAVARELGVAPSTLRTWERRYRLIVPRRGPGGQRLYDAEQIQALRAVLAQVKLGARAGAAHHSAALLGPVRSVHLELEPDVRAPGHARRAVDEVLAGLDDRRFAFFLRLIASELVSNAVLHAGGREPVVVDLELFTREARLRVQSRGARFSLKSLRRQRADAGRGLEIIEALAEAWTIEAGPLGPTVTAQLVLTADPGLRSEP